MPEAVHLGDLLRIWVRSKSAARRQPRRTATTPGGAATVTVAEEIREKGPTHVQSRRRPPPEPKAHPPDFHAPSGRPSSRRASPTPKRQRDTGPSDRPSETLPSGEDDRRRRQLLPQPRPGPAPLRTPARPTQPLEPILIPKLRI
ncbi:unnamed protein product [Lota lota]